jgi:hypothetical protein
MVRYNKSTGKGSTKSGNGGVNLMSMVNEADDLDSRSLGIFGHSFFHGSIMLGLERSSLMVY